MGHLNWEHKGTQQLECGDASSEREFQAEATAVEVTISQVLDGRGRETGPCYLSWERQGKGRWSMPLTSKLKGLEFRSPKAESQPQPQPCQTDAHASLILGRSRSGGPPEKAEPLWSFWDPCPMGEWVKHGRKDHLSLLCPSVLCKSLHPR